MLVNLRRSVTIGIEEKEIAYVISIGAENALVRRR